LERGKTRRRSDAEEPSIFFFLLCELIPRTVHASLYHVPAYHGLAHRDCCTNEPPQYNENGMTLACCTTLFSPHALFFLPRTEMSHTVSLEELEARCDLLQRRVLERSGAAAAQSVARSPPRASPAFIGATAGTTVPAGSSPSAIAASPSVVASALSPADVRAAVSHLEREKARLENELRLVNTHLAAYHSLGLAVPAAAPLGGVRALSPRSSVASAMSPVPPHSVTSPMRHRSPARTGGGLTRHSPSRVGGGNVAAEQIYEELRQIRRAREEREAQRRAAAVTSPGR